MESDRLFQSDEWDDWVFWWVIVAHVFLTEGTMTMTERVWDVSDAETNRRLYRLTWLEQSSIQAWCTEKCKFSYKTTIVLLSERVAFYLPLAQYNNTDQQYWFVQLIKQCSKKTHLFSVGLVQLNYQSSYWTLCAFHKVEFISWHLWKYLWFEFFREG